MKKDWEFETTTPNGIRIRFTRKIRWSDVLDAMQFPGVAVVVLVSRIVEADGEMRSAQWWADLDYEDALVVATEMNLRMNHAHNMVFGEKR